MVLWAFYSTWLSEMKRYSNFCPSFRLWGFSSSYFINKPFHSNCFSFHYTIGRLQFYFIIKIYKLRMMQMRGRKGKAFIQLGSERNIPLVVSVIFFSERNFFAFSWLKNFFAKISFFLLYFTHTTSKGFSIILIW